ncbi:hypothetical protein ACVIW2_005068 [Bradyrhizobium huanghuaihaiense]
MMVDFSGVVTTFDKVPLGGFFHFDLRTGGSYGICVGIAENKRAALSLPTPSSKDRRFGWIQVGGLNHQTVIHFPEAVLRPVLTSATEAGSTVGSVLICAGERKFIKGYEDHGMHQRTFDVETGMTAEITPLDIVNFAQWRVGKIVDGRFEELYCFPPAPAG